MFSIPGITRIHNVFFTLFLGYLGLCALEALWEKPLRSCYVLPDSSVFSFVLHADYSWHGFLLILIMYLLGTQKFQQALVKHSLDEL